MIKLRMIWTIIRGRSVMYKMNVQPEFITPQTEHCCIVNCYFDTIPFINEAKINDS